MQPRISNIKSPKLDWLIQKVVSGATIAIGREESAFWQANPIGVQFLDDHTKLKEQGPKDVIMLGEVLQVVDEPANLLQDALQVGKKLILVVPNEHNWDAKFQPLSNKQHKRFYDTEMLCQELERLGLIYLINLIEFAGWSFFAVEAVKP